VKGPIAGNQRKCAAYLRKAALIAASIGAAALSGCVKYHSQALDPPRSEQQFRARTLADAGLGSFLNRADWPPPKLGLNDLTAVAFYFNADLDVARAQVRAAEAGILTARARPNPSISVGGGWTNSPESPLVFHFDPAITLETAGKRGWRILESEELAEAARVQVAETAWRVRSRARAAWLDYVMAVRSLEVLRNERDVRAEAAAILEKRLSVGEAARPDVSVSHAALISVETEAKAAETTVAESGAALASAIGLPSLPPVDTQALPPPPLRRRWPRCRRRDSCTGPISAAACSNTRPPKPDCAWRSPISTRTFNSARDTLLTRGITRLHSARASPFRC